MDDPFGLAIGGVVLGAIIGAMIAGVWWALAALFHLPMPDEQQIGALVLLFAILGTPVLIGVIIYADSRSSK